MADLDDGFTRIANELLKLSCMRVCRSISFWCSWLRKTYGFNKKSDWVSNEQISMLTGILPHKCSAAKAPR